MAVEPLDAVLARFQALLKGGHPTVGDLDGILGPLITGTTSGAYPAAEGTEAILAVWNALVATAQAMRINLVDATWYLHHDAKYAPRRGSPPMNFLAFTIAHHLGPTGAPDELVRSVTAAPPYTLDGITDLEEYYQQIQEWAGYTPTRVGGPVGPPAEPREPSPEEERPGRPGPPMPKVTFGPSSTPTGPPSNRGAPLWAGMNPQTRLDVLDIALGIVNPSERQKYANEAWERLPAYLRAMVSERVEDIRNYLRQRERELEEGSLGPAGPPPPPPPTPSPPAPPQEAPAPPSAPAPPAAPRPALPPITTAEALRPPYLEDFTTFPKGTVIQGAPGRLENELNEVDIIAELSRAIRTGAFARCYVFAGPPGLGKTTLAFALVRSYLRDVGRRRGIPGLGTPDNPLEDQGVVIFGPNQMAGGVDFVLQRVLPSMGTRPMGVPPGTRRWIILDDISQLSPEAQQRLLGEMEKRSASTTLIFTANQVNRLVPALVDRCERGFYVFRTPTPTQITTALRNTIVRLGSPFPNTEQEVAKVMAKKPSSIRVAMDYLVDDYAELSAGET